MQHFTTGIFSRIEIERDWISDGSRRRNLFQARPVLTIDPYDQRGNEHQQKKTAHQSIRPFFSLQLFVCVLAHLFWNAEFEQTTDCIARRSRNHKGPVSAYRRVGVSANAERGDCREKRSVVSNSEFGFEPRRSKTEGRGRRRRTRTIIAIVLYDPCSHGLA